MITERQFRAIEKILQDMDDELYKNAQGDNGYDVQRRRDIYRVKLTKLLKKIKWS